MKNIDDVVLYNNEEEYLSYLKSGDYEIRFLGTDYKDGTYSGKEIDIDIVWLDRENHNYSTTKLKTDIFKSILPRASENYD
jgi:hypothetical protein